MMFEKGEKEFARRRIRTRVDRVEKSKTHTVSSAPLELTIYSHLS